MKLCIPPVARRTALGFIASALALAVSAQQAPAIAAPEPAVLKQQVWDAELAFARTMAERQHAAFGQFVSEEAVFFSGRKALHGRAAVSQAWKPFFEAAKAPFSWSPDQVEVSSGGQLAHSSGPVWSPEGKLIGRFNSVWRLEAPGVWRVLFDRGEDPPCACDEKVAKP